jgi:uncharacterized protein (DUF983 family)
MSEYYELSKALLEWDGVSPMTPINWEEEFPCPACGNLMIGAIDMWEICDVCGWEDDPVQKAYPDYPVGANEVSLNEAKANYALCGFAEPGRHKKEIQALINAGKLKPKFDYDCEVCGGKMPGYLNRWEDCPTCGWFANYADHGIMPENVTEWGTLEEAKERYRLTGSADPNKNSV